MLRVPIFASIFASEFSPGSKKCLLSSFSMHLISTWCFPTLSTKMILTLKWIKIYIWVRKCNPKSNAQIIHSKPKTCINMQIRPKIEVNLLKCHEYLRVNRCIDRFFILVGWNLQQKKTFEAKSLARKYLRGKITTPLWLY